MKWIIKIVLIGLFFIGCGGDITSTENGVNSIDFPTLTTNEEDITINQKTDNSEFDILKNNTHTALWVYYQEERTSKIKDRRWYISQINGKYQGSVFSLMKIKKNRAGWGTVEKNIASIDLNRNKITIGNIQDNYNYRYFDVGWQEWVIDKLIQSDIEKIRNSTVKIKWLFFRASNGAWYITNENSSVVLKFASKNGQYNWEHTIDMGVKPTVFIENGMKKIRFGNNEPKDNLIGIDVSHNNSYINWEAVKNDGVSFAFIKATEGYPETDYELTHQIEKNFLDARFEENMNSAIENGLLVAPYHFIRVDYNEKISDAIEEARYFISKIRPYYTNNKLLPPIIDIENPPSNKEYSKNKNQIGRWSKSEFTNWIKAFANEMESQLGIKPILYMNESFSNNEVDSSLFNTYKLWIAKYMYSSENGTVINSLDDLHSYDTNFKPNRNYLFWQFTETAIDIDGVTGYVDKNIFYGNLNDLKKLLVQINSSDTLLTSVSPSKITANEEDITLTLYGENLQNITKVYIEGVSINDFMLYGDNKIVVSVSKVHGGSVEDKVNFGYREIILKFSDGSKTPSFKDKLYVKENNFVEVNWNSDFYRSKNIFYTSGWAPKNFYSNTSSSKLGNHKGNCTWYVNGRMQELGYNKTQLDKMHSHAYSWSSSAKKSNITVNSTPTVGAIAQSTANRSIYTSYGHVAVVEKVNNDGTIVISESSYGSGAWDFQYRTRVVDIDEFNNYIHISK